MFACAAGSFIAAKICICKTSSLCAWCVLVFVRTGHKGMIGCANVYVSRTCRCDAFWTAPNGDGNGLMEWWFPHHFRWCEWWYIWCDTVPASRTCSFLSLLRQVLVKVGVGVRAHRRAAIAEKRVDFQFWSCENYFRVGVVLFGWKELEMPDR